MNCDYPDCPSGRSEKVQDQRHTETIAHLQKITANQEQTIILLADVRNLSKNFEDFRAQDRKEHDEIFTRLRQVEGGKADKEEVKDIQKTRTKALWEITKLAIAGMLGALGIKAASGGH